MAMTEHEKLVAVADGYHNICLLYLEQRQTIAKMIRACVAQVGSTNILKRKEAMVALSDLAKLLEKGE